MKNMQQFKPGSILLAVDGSTSSKAAAYAATQVASALRWEIHALYVVDAAQVFEMYSDTRQELSKLGDVVTNEQPITLFEEQGALALAEIDDMCQEMNVTLTTEMIFGGVLETILDSARQYSLLALGRRGNRHESNAHHIGSNFRRIAYHTHTPLLIGGDENSPLNHHRILLAYDGSKLARMALSWAETLQRMFADVMALSVEEKSGRDCDWLEKRQKEIADSTLKHYEFDRGIGEPGKIIASVACSGQADLIVMGAYRHSPLREWATHSILSNVVREVEIPILAAK